MSPKGDFHEPKRHSKQHEGKRSPWSRPAYRRSARRWLHVRGRGPCRRRLRRDQRRHAIRDPLLALIQTAPAVPERSAGGLENRWACKRSLGSIPAPPLAENGATLLGGQAHPNVYSREGARTFNGLVSVRSPARGLRRVLVRRCGEADHRSCVQRVSRDHDPRQDGHPGPMSARGGSVLA